MAKNKCPLCWIEEHAENPGNARGKYESEIVPDAGFTEPTYAWIYCEKIDKQKIYFGDKFVSIENCALVIPEGKGKPCKTRDGRDALCFEHIAIYEKGSPDYGKKRAHAGNPGNPDKVERYIKPRRLDQVAEDLTDKDAVTDALWDLRGNILQALKEIGEISPDVTGPEVQGTIDSLIRRLVFLV